EPAARADASRGCRGAREDDPARGRVSVPLSRAADRRIRGGARERADRGAGSRLVPRATVASSGEATSPTHQPHLPMSPKQRAQIQREGFSGVGGNQERDHSVAPKCAGWSLTTSRGVTSVRPSSNGGWLRPRPSHRAALGAALLVACAAPAGASAQVNLEHYVADLDWAQLPPGREWGAVTGVYPDPDGRHIWVLDRCGANSCLGSDLGPIFKFDLEGNLVANFGAGLIAWP